jgi:DNA-binding NarL/FixJ family response regulator
MIEHGLGTPEANCGMRISIVHSHAPTREILTRALSVKLKMQVTGFSCIENLLQSSMDYDTFVVYSDFGHKMSGVRGVAQIRLQKPRAFIIGVSCRPNLDRKFLPAGADAFLLRAGNEIEELVRIIQQHCNITAIPSASIPR